MPNRVAVFVLAIALVAAGCSTTDRGGAADAVTLGAIYPISGLQGPGGVEEANGVAWPWSWPTSGVGWPAGPCTWT